MTKNWEKGSVIKKLLTIPEVADYLRCSQKTVRRLIVRRELKALKVGSALRVTFSSVDLYLDRQILKFREAQDERDAK